MALFLTLPSRKAAINYNTFVVASQLPRSVDVRKDRRPELADIDELGINTDDAKTVLAIYRKDKESSREIVWLKEGALNE